MNSIGRNLLSAFSVVCAIALIVFLVQLIALNSGSDDEGTGAIVSEGTTGGQDGSAPGDGEALGGASSTSGEEAAATATPTPRPPPQGRRYPLPVDEDTRLIVYVEEDKFEYVEGDTDWRFEYRDRSGVGLSISFRFLAPQSGGGSDAETFLNDVLGEEIAEFKGTYSIVDSEMTGYYAQAMKDGTTFEVWLYRLTDDEMPLALAFYVNFEFSEQRDAIYDILSSMSLEELAAG